MKRHLEDLDFTAALLYPYRRENRLNAWIIPTLLLLLALSVSRLDGGITFLVVNVLFSGFFWCLSGVFSKGGLQLPAPSWGHWLTFLRQGIKLFLYLLIISVLVQTILSLPVFLPLEESAASQASLVALILGVVLLIYAAPVVAAPIIASAGDYSLKSLFNLKKARHYLKGRYSHANRAMFQVILIIAIYVLLQIFLRYLAVNEMLLMVYSTVVLLLIMPMLVSCWHMINQGLLLAPKADEPKVD